MASISFKITKTLYVAGTTFRDSKTYTEDSEVSLETTVAGSTNDQQHELEVYVSRMEALFVMARGGDLLLETNNSASGSRDDYLELVDGVPYVWSADEVTAKARVEGGDPGYLIETDINTLYLTNAGSDTVTFVFYALMDSTP